jgi:hypothetical protein
MIGLLVALAGPRPPWVVQELPPAGSTPAQVAVIGAELDLTKVPEVDPASLKLMLDGVDVTHKAKITLTRDWPPSFASITYTPRRLKPGAHAVEVRVRTRDGRTHSHTWTFAVPPPVT